MFIVESHYHSTNLLYHYEYNRSYYSYDHIDYAILYSYIFLNRRINHQIIFKKNVYTYLLI